MRGVLVVAATADNTGDGEAKLTDRDRAGCVCVVCTAPPPRLREAEKRAGSAGSANVIGGVLQGL